jgi:hypothetical protein
MTRKLLPLLGLFPFLSLAQIQVGDIASRIAAREAGGRTFERHDLFTPSAALSTRDALVHVVVERAEVMDLDQSAVSALLAQPPADMLLSLSTPDGTIDLQLERANIFADDFSVVTASTGTAVGYEAGLHYRGIIAGRPKTLAAISIFGNEVMGFVSDQDGNHVLGKIKGGNGEHIYYAEKDLIDPPVMTCSTPEDAGLYDKDQLKQHGQPKTVNCVGLYWEVNFDVFQDKGNVVNTSNYVTGLFNQSATIYANDGISVLLSQLYIWDVASPYTATSTSALLGQFQSTRNSFNGNLGNLLGYAGGGGIAAGFSGLCAGNLDNSQCYSGITGSYNTVPTYSWSAMVVTHEQGHLLGSRHTHACVWNGNNTAIDGCGPAHGYGYEGSCSGAPIPGTGGTIMSYCHLDAVGINFNNGFGTQPKNLIVNNINAAACLIACGAGCGTPAFLSAAPADVSAQLNWGAVAGATQYNVQWKPSSSGTWTDVIGVAGLSYGLTGLTIGVSYDFRVQAVCPGGNSAFSAPSSFTTQACTQTTFTLVLDQWGSETTWSITGPGGVTTYASGGPYNDQGSAGTYPQSPVNICLVNGCYELRVNDSFGDGMWSGSGNGYYTLTGPGGVLLASGGAMMFQTITTFCLPATCTSALPYSQAFDTGLGGWLQNATGVDFQWLRYNTATPSSNTGPDVDHTSGSGYYMYCEASAPNNPSKTAILTSPCFDLSGYTSVTMSFWRHMFGASMGSLNVDVQVNGGSWTTGVWTLSGNQTNSWVQATVNLTPYINSNMRVRFRGVTGGGSTSDMAIDDVSITGTQGVKVDAKLWLEGPYNTGTLTMNDDLRAAGLVPTTEPYTAMGFTNAGGGGGETTTANILSVTGNNAIVDWARIELRSSADPSSIVATRQCLVQRDGDVVSASDGTSPVTLSVGNGSYYVAVRHRNHLGAMTAGTIALSGTAATVDFRSTGTSTYGTQAQKQIGSVMALWAGNTLIDVPAPRLLKYTGASNDRDKILTAIGGTVPTNTISGYRDEDCNLDGTVKYTGSSNDRDMILVNIGGSVPTNTRTEQLP